MKWIPFLSFKPSLFSEGTSPHMPHHCLDAVFLVEFSFLNLLGFVIALLCFLNLFIHMISFHQVEQAELLKYHSHFEDRAMEWQRSNVTVKVTVTVSHQILTNVDHNQC